MHDIATGNNAYAPSGNIGSIYPAATGYDMATGFGTPIVGDHAPDGAPSTYYPGYRPDLPLDGNHKHHRHQHQPQHQRSRHGGQGHD